jgi:hypothetical protein
MARIPSSARYAGTFSLWEKDLPRGPFHPHPATISSVHFWFSQSDLVW